MDNGVHGEQKGVWMELEGHRRDADWHGGTGADVGMRGGCSQIGEQGCGGYKGGMGEVGVI